MLNSQGCRQTTKCFDGHVFLLVYQIFGTNPIGETLFIVLDKEFNRKIFKDNILDMDDCRVRSEHYTRECENVYKA